MRYFTHSEFDSPDAPGSGNDMCNDFLQMIDKIQKYSLQQRVQWN